MTSITRFEDLVAWQKARRLIGCVYALIDGGRIRHDFKFADQLRSASLSVMSNIAEGFERRSPRDFKRFIVMAKASCAEVQSLLICGQ
jgi:four helix bundle protein